MAFEDLFNQGDKGPFGFPAAPIPTPVPKPDVAFTTVTPTPKPIVPSGVSGQSVTCPSGQRPDGRGGCVPLTVNPKLGDNIYSPVTPPVPNPADHRNPKVDPAIPGGGGSDHDWYVREIGSKPDQYDTGISEGQWITWKNMGLWDDASKSWKNENVDAAGNPIPGTGWNKPTDCPDGTTKYNVNQCLPLHDPRVGGSGSGGAGGTGGGGVGRAAASSMSSFGPSAASTSFGNDLQAELTKDLNAPSRYTPEALQAMYAEITKQSAGRIRRGSAAVKANAAGRGMSRAGSVDAALRGVRDASETQRGTDVVGVQTAKINADYQDKMGAIDRAQKYLDSLRDNEYRYSLMAEQRRQFDSNLALAYANLAQQKQLLAAQFQQQFDLLRADQGFRLLHPGA